MTRVIVLRPEPAASETVRGARKLGLEAEAIPLFEIEPVAWEPPEASRFDGLLLTSANALRYGGEQLQKVRGLPVHAVGPATAEAAHQAGFKIASVGEAGVDHLLESLEPDLRLLHLCGEDRKAREAASQEIVAVPVYTARERGISLEGISDAVALVHSPRAGGRLAELIVDRRRIAIAAISPAAAAAAGDGWADVAAADTPTDDALLALAARLCNTMHP